MDRNNILGRSFSFKNLILSLMLASLSACGGGDNGDDSDDGGNGTDTIAPVIILIGSAAVSLSLGDTYVEQGAIATDDVDPTVDVVITGTVDTSTLGSYILTYNATDTAGNAAASVIRSVTVTNIVIATSLLNDTGILWGGNYPSGINLDCIGIIVGEQDCSKGRDALSTAGILSKSGAGHGGFDFTKLDTNGAALSAGASNWSCVRDNHTGLVWEVKDTILNSIHNQNNTYRWGGKTSLLNGTFGTQYNDWDTLIDGSNAGTGLCGFTDWRVPNVKELISIINYNQFDPAIDASYFPNIVSGITSESYWSASPSADDSNYSWSAKFYVGGVHRSSLRSQPSYVFLVRSGM